MAKDNHYGIPDGAVIATIICSVLIPVFCCICCIICCGKMSKPDDKREGHVPMSAVPGSTAPHSTIPGSTVPMYMPSSPVEGPAPNAPMPAPPPPPGEHGGMVSPLPSPDEHVIFTTYAFTPSLWRNATAGMESSPSVVIHTEYKPPTPEPFPGSMDMPLGPHLPTPAAPMAVPPAGMPPPPTSATPVLPKPGSQVLPPSSSLKRKSMTKAHATTSLSQQKVPISAVPKAPAPTPIAGSQSKSGPIKKMCKRL